MRKFVASSPAAQSIGLLVLALTKSDLKNDFLPILRNHGLDQIDPSALYSQQATLDVLNDIQRARINEIDSMVSIGMAVIEALPNSPPEVPLTEIFAGLNTLHHQINCNIPDDEGYRIEVLGPEHVQVTNNTPYPDDLIFGMLWNLVRRRITGGKFSVQMLPVEGSSANDEATTFDVTWKARSA